MQQTDFTQYLHPPVSRTLPPPIIPKEIYPGIIKGHEFITTQQGTPAVRINVALSDWPPSIGLDQRLRTVEDTGEQVPIDLAVINLRGRDFFLTPNAYYRLDQFLEGMGLNVPLVDGYKDYETPINRLLGARVGVMIDVILTRNDRQMNVIQDLVPLASR